MIYHLFYCVAGNIPCLKRNTIVKAIGYNGAFAYTRTLEEARYLVAGQQGLLLLDCFKYLTDPMPGIERKVLTNHGKPMERHYYFISQRNQNNSYIVALRDMFRQVLEEL